MEILQQKQWRLHEKLKSLELPFKSQNFSQQLFALLYRIKSIGFTEQMDEYEKRKLGIFNQLNFLQLLAGIIVPVLGLFPNDKIPGSACFAALLPALLTIAVLSFNYYQKYESALIAYFIVHPFLTCVIYLNGVNLGVDLNFILYGVLAVFFLKDIGLMLFTIAFSMISYFVLSVIWKQYQYGLATANMSVFLFNQALAIAFIFYGLWLIKKENNGYQLSILNKNEALSRRNKKIQRQKKEIAEKAKLLKKQTEELIELNTLKNKLFSVISHDLKSPMYALRKVFQNVQQHHLSANEIKELIPHVNNDLDYTISLMENLLQWSKSQMQAHVVKSSEVNVSQLITEVLQLLHLQAAAKHIYIETKNNEPVYVIADKEMINLVLRNLVSNAIKFTPPQGNISIGVNEQHSFVEVYVQDSGTGIS
ncbi:MAG: sensor histidine kinase, partial [Chitinophagaceae bacterium]